MAIYVLGVSCMYVKKGMGGPYVTLDKRVLLLLPAAAVTSAVSSTPAELDNKPRIDE